MLIRMFIKIYLQHVHFQYNYILLFKSSIHYFQENRKQTNLD